MLSSQLQTLLDLVLEAGEIGRKGFESRGFELKGDGSLVTETDKRVETFFRERLDQVAPGAAFWGEEEGFAEPTEEGLWLIDPIDGTTNFAYGLPSWGVTVGLYRGTEMVLGAMCMPMFNDWIAAEKGKGAFRNGAPLPKLKPGGIEPYEPVGFGDLTLLSELRIPGKIRHVGAFVAESFGFLTQGMRAQATSSLCLYDAACGILAAREIGAELVHYDGRPFQESEWVAPTRVEPFIFLPPDCTWRPTMKVR